MSTKVKTRWLKGQLPPVSGRQPIYPWSQISRGKPLRIEDRTLSSVASCAYAAAKRLGKKFSLRTVKDGKRTHVDVYLRA